MEFKLSLNETVDHSTIANISMSINEVLTNDSIEHETDIKTFLLLSSKIIGEIEHPNYYFSSINLDRKKNLDILLMTQRLKQLDTAATLLDTNSNLSFFYEEGITISGIVRNFVNPDLPTLAEVSIAYKNKEEQGYDVTKTNGKGQFKFKNLNFAGKTFVLIKAKSLNRKKAGAIEIDSMNYPEIIGDVKIVGFSETENHIDKKKIKSKNIVNEDTMILSDHELIKLNEIVVKHRKKISKTANERYSKRMLYRETSQTIDFDKLRKSAPQLNALTALQGRVPGYSLRAGEVYLTSSNSLKGNNKALLIVDGIPVESSAYASAIASIPISEIDFVDILKGPRAAIYGSRAGNGVIAVYTLRNSGKKKTSKKEKIAL